MRDVVCEGTIVDAAMAYRFEMTLQESAAMYVHARLAASMLEALVEQRDHYDDIVSTMREQDGAGPIGRDAVAQWQSLADQLGAFASDVALLAEEAMAQGPEVLQRLRDPAAKADTTLKAPAGGNPAIKALTGFVMLNGMLHSLRDTAEQLQGLSQAMSTVVNPTVLVFASELDQLAVRLRPAGMQPGPYAPLAKPSMPNN